jgi:hypothetical protein
MACLLEKALPEVERRAQLQKEMGSHVPKQLNKRSNYQY